MMVLSSSPICSRNAVSRPTFWSTLSSIAANTSMCRVSIGRSAGSVSFQSGTRGSEAGSRVPGGISPISICR